MRPSSSGMVLALTIVPGILESFLIIQLKTIFPMSRLTRKLHTDTGELFLIPCLQIKKARNAGYIMCVLNLHLMGTI